MKKILLWTAVGMVSIVAVLFVAFKYLQAQTKKLSPESQVEYREEDRVISVKYSRPSLRGRQMIGGASIPYGKVWRTGANEATTFSVSHPVRIDGQSLPAGTYTLWTIPEENSWTIIFNKKLYPWGVSMRGVAAREMDFDALKVVVPVTQLAIPAEQFTITLESAEGPALTLAWDHVQVSAPIAWE